MGDLGIGRTKVEFEELERGLVEPVRERKDSGSSDR